MIVFKIVDMKKLTFKMEQFCKEYLIDLNATQAAIRAGYSKHTSGAQGQRLLTKPRIAERIQQLMDERSDRVEITADAVLQELAKLGFSNIRNLYDKKGRLLGISKLPEDVSVTIQEITEDSIGKEDDNVVTRRKYKLADKRGSLELLGKHLKLFTDKVEQSGPDGGSIKHDVNVTFVRPGDIKKH